MSPIRYGLWLLGQVSGGFLVAWPFTLAAVAALIWSLWSVPPALRNRFYRVLLLSVSVYGLAFWLVFLGVVLEIPSRAPRVEVPRVFIASALACLIVALLIVGYAGRRLRLRAAGALTLPLWFAYWCYFVAGMSVTGDWM